MSKIEKLASFLKLSPDKLLDVPFCLPPRIARKIKKGSLKDPLLRQFVPLKDELKNMAGFSDDPLSENRYKKGALIQKYRGRALLLASPSCPMLCRFCFRKTRGAEDIYRAMALIKRDKSISEIILSGGDPLSLNNRALKKLLLALDGISHVKRIRIHSRFIIGFPERVDETFLKILANVKKQLFFVLHINHPNELDADIVLAIKKMQKAGIPILSQSVLLKGVNDSLSTLKELLTALIDIGIIPYYLHQLDRVSGSYHFEVKEEKGKKLIKKLSEILPGYAIPKYAKEVLGGKGKNYI